MGNPQPQNASSTKTLSSSRIKIQRPPNVEMAQHEKILYEANAFTNAIVDCMHGVLPTSSQVTHDRIRDLIQDLVGLSETTLRHFYDLELNRSKSHVKNIQRSTLFPQLSYHLWHEVSQLRRIISRIVRAVQGAKHSEAYHEGRTDVPLSTLARFADLRIELANLICEQSYSTVRETSSKATWCELAVMYEATLILRGRGKVSSALSLCQAADSIQIDENCFLPKKGVIKGLMSFNPELFYHSVFEEKDKINFLLKAAQSLFTVSRTITLNSRHAAIQATNHLQYAHHEDEQTKLNTVFSEMVSSLENYQERNLEIHISSILQIESLLRVVCHGLINQHENETDTPNEQLSFRISTILKMHKLYERLEHLVSSNDNVDQWVKHMILAKIRQDGGILFSNNVPAIMLEVAQGEGEGRDPEVISMAQSIQSRLEDGWSHWKDCPARIRQRYRAAIIRDLLNRPDNLYSYSLPELQDLIGNPNVPNPLTKGGGSLLQWFWSGDNEKSQQSLSKHLQHFPQSNINKAQISVTMAYMQLLLKRMQGSNYFSKIHKMVTFDDSNKKTENHTWKVSREIKNRPQFTLGHLKKPYNNLSLSRLIEKEQSKKLEKKFILRKNVTRINGMDPLMFAATTLNYLEELISDGYQHSIKKGRELSNLEQKLDRAARLTRLNLEHTPLGELEIHVHDVIHAAQEAAQSPMRVLQHKHDSTFLNEDELIDQILRVCFARLYSLTIKVEQVARLLIDAPLRQPYQNSSVLILDQVRALLEFLHSEWLEAEEVKFQHGNEENPPEVQLDPSIVSCLHGLNKIRGHIGFHFSKNKSDRFDQNLVRGDLEIEYLLSNGLKRRGNHSMRTIVEQNRQRLNFTDPSMNSWDTHLKRAIINKHERQNKLTDNDKSDLFDFLNLGNNEQADSEIPGNNELIQQAISKIRDSTDREWILWTRLALFPVAFDGRTIVSSTTFSEININEDGTPTSLLWGVLKESYNSEF